MPNNLKKKLALGQKMLLKIRVQPKSGKHEISKLMTDGTLKIKLKSPAENGKANEELIKLLSNFFEVHHEKIIILSGKTGRNKLIEIQP